MTESYPTGWPTGVQLSFGTEIVPLDTSMSASVQLTFDFSTHIVFKLAYISVIVRQI